MRYRSLLLILLPLLLVSVAAGSTTYTNPNFTPIYNKTDVVHVNQSYVIADQNAISWPEWLFEALLGLFLFVLSTILSTKPEYSAQQLDAMFSAMSMLPMFVAAFSSTAIDFVTSSGAAANAVTPAVYTLMENHTIYHFDTTGIVLWIFAVISTLNTIRIVVNHRKFDQMFKSQGEP